MKDKYKALLFDAQRYVVAVAMVAVAVFFTRQFGEQNELALTSLFYAAVMVSAWYGGLGPGLVSTILAVLASDHYFTRPADAATFDGANLVRLLMFLFAALLISLLNGVRRRLYSELQEALAQVKLLRGLLPICASCKMIRDEKGDWHQIENYISEHSEARFTHGTCPECFKEQFPGSYEKYKKLFLKPNDIASR